MSIPAQGRRSVLFPPPGVRIRRTIETQFLPGTPTMIAGHDPRRVLLTVMPDSNSGVVVAFGGSQSDLSTPVAPYSGATVQIYFWGPEEVWAECTYPFSPPGGTILIQSVFYD